MVNLYLVMLFNFRPLKGKAFLVYMPVLFFKGSSRGGSIHAIEIALSSYVLNPKFLMLLSSVLAYIADQHLHF